MAKIHVHRSGPLTTVQDLGRWGYQAYGVPTAGAADRFRYRLGNYLLGNPDDCAALEYWLIGPEIEAVDGPVRVALMGSAGTWTRLDGQRFTIPAWRTWTLHPGERLAMEPTESGAVGYLCFAGGLDVPQVMGSRSTYVRGHFGGKDGRPLKVGDELNVMPTVPTVGEFALLTLPAEPQGPIRVVLGPQDHHFDQASKDRFFGEVYKISPQSDRMGKRMLGPQLEFAKGKTADIVSDGMVHGSIQVPGSGEPIIMLSDRATVGGYAKIGTVISADLPRFSRCKPGAEFRFEAVSVEQAEEALAEHEQLIADILAAAVPAAS